MSKVRDKKQRSKSKTVTNNRGVENFAFYNKYGSRQCCSVEAGGGRGQGGLWNWWGMNGGGDGNGCSLGRERERKREREAGSTGDNGVDGKKPIGNLIYFQTLSYHIAKNKFKHEKHFIVLVVV